MKDEELPLVSPFTLVYNTGQFVIEALKSVQANNYPNLDHVIIDDCSSDDSARIVEDWIRENNYKCTFIKHEKNQGVCRSLNEVMTLAKGEFTFGVSDDLISSDYIRTCVHALKKAGPEYCLSYCNSRIIDEDGGVIAGDYYAYNNFSFEKMPAGDVYREILLSNFINSIGAMYRRAYIDEVGRYDESLYFEDWDLHIRLLKKFKVFKISQTLTSYRVRKNSISAARNPRYYESLLLISFKILKFPESDKGSMRTRIADHTEYYLKAGGDRLKMYWESFMNAPGFKTLTFLIMRLTGLGYKTYRRMSGR